VAQRESLRTCEPAGYHTELETRYVRNLETAGREMLCICPLPCPAERPAPCARVSGGGRTTGLPISTLQGCEEAALPELHGRNGHWVIILAKPSAAPFAAHALDVEPGHSERFPDSATDGIFVCRRGTALLDAGPTELQRRARARGP